MASSTHPAAEVRRLWPADMPSFRDHLLRLDARSRHERFGGGMSDDFIIHYAENCFGQGDLVFGAFVDGHARRGRIALQRGDLDASRRRSSAISTPRRPSASKKPIAGAASANNCSGASSSAASNHGVETIEIVCMPDNISMIRLAAKFKTQFSFEENQMTGRLTARRPTAVLDAARGVARRHGLHRVAVRRAAARDRTGRCEERVTGAPATGLHAAGRSSCS